MKEFLKKIASIPAYFLNYFRTALRWIIIFLLFLVFLCVLAIVLLFLVLVYAFYMAFKIWPLFAPWSETEPEPVEEF